MNQKSKTSENSKEVSAEGAVNEEKLFEVNYRKLEKLAAELQDNRISIDELVPRMKEAAGAIRVCKEVLQKTKLQLEEVSEEFKQLDS